MAKFHKLRRGLANLIYWQWRKMSLLSSIAYALLIKNGDEGKRTVEGLERYLDENDNADRQRHRANRNEGIMTEPILYLTERELKEIKLALIYHEQFQHGTDGHNRLNLIARLAEHVGFNLDKIDADMEIPPVVTTVYSHGDANG